MSKILDGLDFAWSTGDIEISVFRNRFRIAEKLAGAAKNTMTVFPSPAFDFDDDFDLWPSINMQLDAKSIIGADRLNRALSYVFYFIQCGLAWNGEDLYIPIIRMQGRVHIRRGFSLQKSLKNGIHQKGFEIYEKLKCTSTIIGLATYF